MTADPPLVRNCDGKQLTGQWSFTYKAIINTTQQFRNQRLELSLDFQAGPQNKGKEYTALTQYHERTFPTTIQIDLLKKRQEPFHKLLLHSTLKEECCEDIPLFLRWDFLFQVYLPVLAFRFGDAEDASQRACSEVDWKAHWEDVKRDGKIVLQLHFETQETCIDVGDIQACLMGTMTNGIRIPGCAAILTKLP